MTLAPTSTLSRSQLVSYGIAQVGSSTFIFVPALLLMPFMTSVLGIGAALAGLVIFLPKLWVVVCDPLMGTLSDRVRTRQGRRRPFVLWGGLATALAIVLIFDPPPQLHGELSLGLYLMLSYLLGSTAYSAFVVPYISMAAEMTPDPQDRTRVTAWRVGFGYAGSLIGMSAPLLSEFFGNGRSGYAKMALILGALCFVATTVAYIGTRSIPTTSEIHPATAMISQLRSIFSNVEFTFLFRCYILQMLAVGAAGANFPYYIIYQLGGHLRDFAYFGICVTLGGLTAQPFWVWFADKAGKTRAYRVSIGTLTVAELLYLLPGQRDFAIAYAITLLVGAAAAGYPIMAYSMLSDAIVRDSSRSGLHREGSYSGIWMAGEKVALASGVMLVGLLLRGVGFASSTQGFAVQSNLAHWGVRLINGAVTPLLLLFSLWLLSRYRETAYAGTAVCPTSGKTVAIDSVAPRTPGRIPL